MKYKLQTGGIVTIKSQQSESNIPKRQESPKSAIPIKGSTASVPQPLKPYVPPMERLRKIITKMKTETNRPKVIGPWEIAYGKPARVVENGGNIT